MNSPPSEEIHQEQQEEGNLEWLQSFLKRTFFGACSVHQNLAKNDLNRYCIDCNQSACKYCIASDTHAEHRVLKIYRHVYKDVVPLEEIQSHIDCSKIQSYRCNKQMVISLNPLPHCGSGEANRRNSCIVCMRKLYEPMLNDYCSIACKYPVAASSQEETSESESESESEDEEDAALPEREVKRHRREDEADAAPPEPEVKRHRRKGIPRRAPFF